SYSMGTFAQDMADKKAYRREQMDNFAIHSLQHAQHAITHGYFRDEIVPVTVKHRKDQEIVHDDEPPFLAHIDKIPLLKPAFKQNGTITAANASSIADGAAVLLIASETMVREKNLQPLARIVATTTHSQHPSEFTIAPIGAIHELLHKTG